MQQCSPKAKVRRHDPDGIMHRGCGKLVSEWTAVLATHSPFDVICKNQPYLSTDFTSIQAHLVAALELNVRAVVVES